MTKEECQADIKNLKISVGDSYKRNSDGTEFKIHDITPQTNSNDFNSYHVQVGLIDKSNKSTSEKLSSFHSLFTKI
jgi:hypothetical protein